MTLLERESELALLHNRYELVQLGSGGFVLLDGEAGIGKTSLVRALGATLPEGAPLLLGSCDPLSTPAAHAPLHDVADALGAAVLEHLRSGSDSAQLFSLVAQALRARPGTVFVIEDIHWADDATIDLLRYLSRRIESLPALVIATVRTDEAAANGQLRPFLGELARAPGSTRLTLSPLSESAVATLVGSQALDATALHARTKGNPYFLVQLLESGGRLTRTVSDAILGRWAGLSEDARAMVQVVALLWPGVRMGVVELALGAPAPSLIEEASAAGLLDMTPQGVEFRHALAREAIVESITPLRLQEIDRTILRVLPRSDEMIEPAWMAHYAVRAHDREATVQYSALAAEQARALGAHRQAARHYRDALDAAAGMPDTDRVALERGYAAVTSILGWADENVRVRRELRAHFRSTGDLRAEIDELREIATSSFNAGNNPAGEAAISEALDLLAELPEDDLHARVYANRAMTFMLERKTVEAVAWGNRAITLAERFDDPLTVIRAQNAIGSAQIVSGNLAAGAPVLRQGYESARKLGQQSIAVNLLSNLGTASGEIFELETAESALRQVIADARAADLDGPLSYGLAWLGLVRFYRGAWAEGVQLAHEALATPHALPISQIMALVTLGRTRARRGDSEEWDALDQALELATPTGTLQRLAPVACARAEARWLAGDSTLAATEAWRGVVLAARHRHRWLGGELAYWIRLAGDDTNPHFALGEPWERWLAGEPLAAAEAWDRIGCPYEAARARFESSEPDQLRAAMRTFESLGARPMIEQTGQRLRELGVSVPRGPRHTTRQNPAGLTRRELDVLELLQTGATNAAIGEALFVSARTVEHHVSSILAKLNATSRTDAVNRATTLGILV